MPIGYTPEPEPYFVEEWLFRFANGLDLPITIDSTQGDRIEQGPETITIHLAAKPSRLNPRAKLDAEDHTIYLDKLNSSSMRFKLVEPITVSDQAIWMDLLKQAGMDRPQ